MYNLLSLRKDILRLGGAFTIIIFLDYIINPNDPNAFVAGCIGLVVFSIYICFPLILEVNNEGKIYDGYYLLGLVYQRIGLILGVVLYARLSGYTNPKYYIITRLGLDFYEGICLWLVMKQAARGLTKKKVIITINIVLVFVAVVCIILNNFVENEMPFYEPTRWLQVILTMVMLYWIVKIYVYKKKSTFEYVRQENWSNFFYFLMFKLLYHIVSFLKLQEGYTMCNVGMVTLRFLYSYYLIVSAFYIAIEYPWQELVKKVDETDNQIQSNATDRNTIINLSHELKTPINVIQSAVDLIKLDIEDGESAMDDIRVIKKDCYESIKVITMMIDINKLKSNFISLKYGVYNIVEIVENVVQAIIRTYPLVNLILDTEEEEIYVFLDRDMIQRGLVYLLGMVIKRRKKNSCIGIVIKKDKELNNVSIKIYNSEVTVPKVCIEQDIKHCKQEEASDLMAIRFMNRVLKLHDATLNIINGNGVNMNIVFNKIASNEEDLEVIDEEANIAHIIEQIKIEGYKEAL